MNKLKVCVIGNDYKQQFPLIDYGGIESCVENIAIGLNDHFKNDVDFCVIVPKILKNKRDYGFNIIETNEIETSISNKQSIYFANEVKQIILNSKIKPDVLWTQSHWSAILLKDLGIPIICTSHDSAINEGNGDKFIYSPNVYYRFVSKYLLDNNFNLNDERQKNIYNHSFYLHTGLTDDNYHFQPNKQNYVLWVAGLHWGMQAKGLNDFIKLSQMNPGIDFVCYGTGNDQIANYLKTLQPKMRNFYFMGKLDKGPMHTKAFGEARFFMMLSNIPEAFGRTGLEAISKGTPVIGYNSGSIPEQINYKNVGFVAESNNLEKISEELYKTYDYKECYEFSKRYHIKNEVSDMINKSKQILKENNNG